MNLCKDNGWDENHRPVCVGCANPIGVRGDTPDNAVLAGEVLACQWSDGTWVAHFSCRRFDWYSASLTDDWWKRTMGADRTYALMTSRPDWVRKQPEFMHNKALVGAKCPNGHLIQEDGNCSWTCDLAQKR